MLTSPPMLMPSTIVCASETVALGTALVPSGNDAPLFALKTLAVAVASWAKMGMPPLARLVSPAMAVALTSDASRASPPTWAKVASRLPALQKAWYWDGRGGTRGGAAPGTVDEYESAWDSIEPEHSRVPKLLPVARLVSGPSPPLGAPW